MTMILTQPEPVAAVSNPPRMLTIGVNLLPPEVVDSRRDRKVRWIVLTALAGFTILLGAWYGLVSYQASIAATSLRGAEDRVLHLQQQQRDYADLVGAQSESRLVRSQLSALMAKDVQWSRLLTAMHQAAPNGVRLTEASAELAAAGAGANSSAVKLPNASPEAAVGTFTVTGIGPDKKAVADYVDALGKVSGVANPLLTDATPQEGAVQFTVRLDITTSAVGDRYESKTTGQTGAK